MSNIEVKTGDFVNLTVSTSCESTSIERRFSKAITVTELKGKLELMTGGSINTMKLTIFDKEDKLICSLDNDDSLLGSYSIDDGMRLHVEDNFMLRKQLDDAFNIKKFELTEEEYSQRKDSLKTYLMQNRLGKYNEEEMEKREAMRKREEEMELEKLKTCGVGLRCQVSVPGQSVRRATIKFIGTVNFKPGNWIGVQYDEPLGKNDGSVEGVRYFECPPKYGGFVKPLHLEVGDFPEEELNLDEDDEL
uniref:Putative tubulin-folding cofactor b-like protein n=1 Tax=Triatoma dimidiata TaxID=72491 RepID=A0A0V0G7T1_TRIDM